MVAHNYMVITGGGDGIMGAAQRGAGREHSFGLNIRLPFEQHANVTIEGDPKLINFNYFFTRKLNFVKETHAFALFPGGFGTMDEGFEVLTLMQTGKARIIPVVLLDRPDGTYWQTWMKFLPSIYSSSDTSARRIFISSKACPTSRRRCARFCTSTASINPRAGSANSSSSASAKNFRGKQPGNSIEDFSDIVRTGAIVQGKRAAPGKKRARDLGFAATDSHASSPQLRPLPSTDRRDQRQ